MQLVMFSEIGRQLTKKNHLCHFINHCGMVTDAVVCKISNPGETTFETPLVLIAPVDLYKQGPWKGIYFVKTLHSRPRGN